MALINITLLISSRYTLNVNRPPVLEACLRLMIYTIINGARDHRHAHDRHYHVRHRGHDCRPY
jgi:hypothetical protein